MNYKNIILMIFLLFVLGYVMYLSISNNIMVFDTGFPSSAEEILDVESRKRFESPRHPVGVSGLEPTAPILRDSVRFTPNIIEGASSGMTYTATDMQAIIKCADKSEKYSGFTADNISTIMTETPSVFDVSGAKIVCTKTK
jgi:hypothetical protein